jgi:cellulose synthase/poly-beta-1,6-N-acetylglucosamine synthase-like glycosyltransferase
MVSLNAQSTGKPVEILVNGDNGNISVGTKRNLLLYSAKGDYVAYVDDDDMVSEDYIDSILKAVESKPDCVGIEGKLESNMGTFIFRHSIQFQGWYTGSDGFYRTPNHLNPIKRSIAEKIGFPDKMFGEDQLFSHALRRALKTEVYIDHPVYFYKKEFPAV